MRKMKRKTGGKITGLSFAESQSVVHDRDRWQVLFTNPSAGAGYDTRSIFKRSLTGLNSEFSFS